MRYPWGFRPVSTRCLPPGRPRPAFLERSLLSGPRGLGEAFSSAQVSLFLGPVLPSGSSLWAWISQVSRWWFSFRVLACSGFSVGRSAVAEAAAASLSASGRCTLGGASAAAAGAVFLELHTQWVAVPRWAMPPRLSEEGQDRCRHDTWAASGARKWSSVDSAYKYCLITVEWKQSHSRRPFPSTKCPVLLGCVWYSGHWLCTRISAVLFSSNSNLLGLTVNLMAPMTIKTKKITQ